MKKISFFLFVTAILILSNQYCHAKMLLNFKAIDTTTNISVKPDSIVIRDLTKGLQKTITDTSYDMNLLFTDVNENESTLKPSFINKNFPNPFDNTTNFQIFVSEPSEVTFTLFDILGNMIFTITENTQDGYHNFRLIANGLEPGSYYLKISDNKEQSYLKFIKMGSRTGAGTSFENYGADLKTNGKPNNPEILLVDNDIYSFKCYAKGYQTVKFDNVNMSTKKSRDTLTFLSQPLNKYNIHSGYIDVSGINCKYFWQKDWTYRSGEGSNDTATHFKAYNFIRNIQNISVMDTEKLYLSFGKFLPCQNISNDSLIINFCAKSFSASGNPSSGANLISNSTIVQIFFNKNSNKIDSIKFNLYYNNWFTKTNSYGQDINTNIYNNLYLYNLPYRIDSLNHLVVNIFGKNIKDYLKIGYNNYTSSYGNFGASTGMGHEYENFVSIESVDDNAYIKLILSQ